MSSVTSNFGVTGANISSLLLLLDALVGELKKELNSSLALTEWSDKSRHLRIGDDVQRRGEDAEESRSRELLRDQHLLLTSLNLTLNLATLNLNSVTLLSGCCTMAAYSPLRYLFVAQSSNFDTNCLCDLHSSPTFACVPTSKLQLLSQLLWSSCQLQLLLELVCSMSQLLCSSCSNLLMATALQLLLE